MTTAPPRPSSASGGDVPAGPGGQPPPVARPAPAGHRLRYVLVGLVLVGSLGFLLAKGLGTSLNFYLPADQAVRQAAGLGGRTINIEGVVEPGSIHATRTGVDFVITSGTTAVTVYNSGSPPELFQPSIPVIAVGHFRGSSFVSNQILVKHTSDYIAAHPGRVTASDGTKR